MHSDGVKPIELINALVERSGGANRVAKAMGRPAFQGTLWKFCNGTVATPTRGTAARIADQRRQEAIETARLSMLKRLGLKDGAETAMAAAPDAVAVANARP